MRTGIALVVPCFNEARRLDTAAFKAFSTTSFDTHFCLVDDGSTDGTLAVLEGIRQGEPGRVSVLSLSRNQGKAEAVRQGMQSVLAQDFAFVGFWDADLATPLSELPFFYEVFEAHPKIEIVLGSRVRLLGRSIDRSPLRHYLGRVFATGASLTLGLPIYDTQCGAKLFRVTPTLRGLWSRPFVSRWVFDVEILVRYLRALEGQEPAAADRIFELPLTRWSDVPGSKVHALDFFRAGIELLRIRSQR